MKFQIIIENDIIETATKAEATKISTHIDKDHQINLVINEEKEWGPFAGSNMWAEVSSALEIMGYSE